MNEKEFRALMFRLLTGGNVRYQVNGFVIGETVDRAVALMKEEGWLSTEEETEEVNNG